MGCEVNIDKGTILIPECQGHRDHNRVGQPPSPMMPPVRHYGALEGSERAAYCHHSVFQGDGMEEKAAGIRGDTGECEEGLSGLRQAARDGHLIQIPGVVLDGGG